MFVCGSNLVGGDIPTLQYFECIFGSIVQYLIVIGAILFFVTFIMGGFKYLTSSGDPKAIESAHKTLSYAVLGLILTVLAYTILLVIQTITGADVTNFRVFIP